MPNLADLVQAAHEQNKLETYQLLTMRLFTSTNSGVEFSHYFNRVEIVSVSKPIGLEVMELAMIEARAIHNKYFPFCEYALVWLNDFYQKRLTYQKSGRADELTEFLEQSKIVISSSEDMRPLLMENLEKDKVYNLQLLSYTFDAFLIKCSTLITELENFQKTFENKKMSQRGYVYLVKSISGHFKIGRSKDIKNRLRTFSVKLPFEIELEHVFYCEDCKKTEAELHERFADKRINGEWFALSASDVNYFKNLQDWIQDTQHLLNSE